MIVLTLASSILVFHAITSNTQSLFAQIKRGIVISIANSSYVPLTNTDANQVRVNVKYTIEDDTLKIKIKRRNEGDCSEWNIDTNYFNSRWIYC
jgi:hypothetical protein